MNDAQFAIWRRCGVRVWPTLVLIDPAGYLVGVAAGEGPGPAAAGRLYIADTNNHRIRVADLAAGAVATLHLRHPDAGDAPQKPFDAPREPML